MSSFCCKISVFYETHGCIWECPPSCGCPKEYLKKNQRNCNGQQGKWEEINGKMQKNNEQVKKTKEKHKKSKEKHWNITTHIYSTIMKTLRKSMKTDRKVTETS